jgi:hypothetical protein
MSVDCRDTRQPLIDRKKEKDSRRNVVLIPQHEY